MAEKKNSSMTPTQVVGFAIEQMQKMAGKEKKILRYLKGQRDLLLEELRPYQTPIDPDTLRDIRKMEEIILRKRISHMDGIIRTIELMLEEDEETEPTPPETNAKKRPSRQTRKT